MPPAYNAPTKLPELLPEMHEMGIFSSCRTERTPICATPQEAPLPRASPILGFFPDRVIQSWNRSQRFLTTLPDADFSDPSFVFCSKTRDSMICCHYIAYPFR